MDIIINFDKVAEIFSLPADVLVASAFLYLGWIPIAIFIMWAAFLLWMDYIRSVYASNRTFILLALDIPVANEQTPAAVEKMFAHLAGAHFTRTLIETYWEGKTQDSFSFEIVSIDGYTQYIIYTMPQYRALIEAVIYAEYPDAEITEIEDYTSEIPDKYPDDNYDIWGGEWLLAKSSYYPIRTYLDFEHQFSGDFKDPLAALMELFSSLRKGEQCWYQIILTPVGQDFPQGADDEIKKAIGQNDKASKGILDVFFLDPFLKLLSGLADFIIPGEAGEREAEKEQEINMLNLKPLQKKSIEAIQQKVSKLVFDVKIRFIYVADKEVMNKVRANSFVGFMKQFGVEDLNAFKPDMNVTVTTAKYMWIKSRINARKRRIMAAYKARSNWRGRLSFSLNIEELATIWHFPVETAVKAPMLQKIPSRKTEAPAYLPIEGADTVSQSSIDLEQAVIKGGENFNLAADEKHKKHIKKEMEEEFFGGPEPSGSSQSARLEPPSNLPIA